MKFEDFQLGMIIRINLHVHEKHDFAHVIKVTSHEVLFEDTTGYRSYVTPGMLALEYIRPVEEGEYELWVMKK